MSLSKSKKIEDWERGHINTLTVRMLFIAAIATAVATTLTYVLHASGMPRINPELLFLPWGIVLVFGVSHAFHRGVLAERERMRTATDLTRPHMAASASMKDCCAQDDDDGDVTTPGRGCC